MRAAIVQGVGQAPVWGEFTEPVAGEGEQIVEVAAAALTHVTRARASGSHYSSAAAFPFVPGVDGVGRLDDGTRVYFMLPKAPFGAMAERTVIRPAQGIDLPEGLDDVTAAAIANPGMSSWAAYVERAHLQAGETVLINGATGVAGKLAVQIAKHLGAKKVIAIGRSKEHVEATSALGADATIEIGSDFDAFEEAVRPHFDAGVDVVIDYLWGRSAERLLIAAARASKDAVPLRFVAVGSASGEDITLPGAVLRSSAIEVMGSGLGSIPMARFREATRSVLEAAIPAGLKVDSRAVPLADVTDVWTTTEGRDRVVFVP